VRPFSDDERLHIIKAHYDQGRETGKTCGQIARELNEMFPENRDDPRTPRGVQNFLHEYRKAAALSVIPV
jgi:hypothetical protein